MSTILVPFDEIMNNDLLPKTKQKVIKLSPTYNAVLGSMSEEKREELIGQDLLTDLVIGAKPKSPEVKGVTIMGLAGDDQENISFGIMVRTLKSGINTLDRNLLSLEIRTGIQGPRDAQGDPIPYTGSSHDLWVDFLDAINLSYPQGIPCDLKEFRLNNNLFPEQDELEKILHRESLGSLEERMEARRKARKG